MRREGVDFKELAKLGLVISPGYISYYTVNRLDISPKG